ncbi:response regulator [Candidatus Parabeggiatoa sp. HSG14]|uniref:response regulator n=1 Tax=Candidatus Parabeggiatoa sp. HSG14 TaxID=3055593 RepID=UPI0025A84D09|nr:response regulator [Thiotrichales bacterium HSG14]
MKRKSMILIVDDDPEIRASLEILLDNQGYKLAFASNGIEALNKAAQLIPDVILLDVMMPGMDGFEVCQHLRANPILSDVPIIMVSGLGGRDALLQGIQAGADDFISKPYDPLELQTRLKTITNLNRYRHILAEKAKFEWIIEKINEAFLTLNYNGEILYANPHARFYLNLPVNQDEPINETFLELVAQHYKCEPQEAWTALKPPKSVSRYLVRPETSTSHALWLRVDMMEMDTGRNEQYLIHLRDVTEIIFLRTS